MPMDYIILPVTNEPAQTLYLPVSPGGHAFQARVDLRYRAAPGRWFLSISDALTGETFVNQIPLVCSLERLNDLLFPFLWRFQGDGLGSLFCVKAVDHPKTVDPGPDNLNEFYLLWGDKWQT